MDLTALILLTVLVAIALAAPRYGVDSRLPPPGQPPAPLRRPATITGDLAALARWLLRRGAASRSTPTARA